MSHDDNQRPLDPRDRGAYTPPTDDDLPFNRGGFDARRPAPRGAPPMTLIVSALVLVILVVAVAIFYRSGLRSSTDAPPAVGTPVGALTVDAPLDAQPVDPEAGINVYRDDPADTGAPTFAPPPEAPLPRQPPPVPLFPAPNASTSPVVPDAPPAPPVTETPPPPRPAVVGGTAAVQIGAFSSTAIADREYAAVAGRFPQFASGRTKRVEQVTASNGSTVYRTTFGGFSREEATAFCAALRAAGRDCLVR